jgi:hypothetical protein
MKPAFMWPHPNFLGLPLTEGFRAAPPIPGGALGKAVAPSVTITGQTRCLLYLSGWGDA